MQVNTEIDIERFAYTPADRQIWEEELDAFVPSTIYDAHYHLWSEDAIANDHPQRGALLEVDRVGAQSFDRQMFPDREIVVTSRPFYVDAWPLKWVARSSRSQILIPESLPTEPLVYIFESNGLGLYEHHIFRCDPR